MVDDFLPSKNKKPTPEEIVIQKEDFFDKLKSKSQNTYIDLINKE